MRKKEHSKSVKELQRKNYFITLVCGVVVILCIIILSLFGQNRWINSITITVGQLAMAYIAAFIFYCHTEIATDRIQYERLKMFIQRNLFDLNYLIRDLLENQCWDEAYDEHDAENNLNDTMISTLRLDCYKVELKVMQLIAQNWQWTDSGLLSKVYNLCKNAEDRFFPECEIDKKEYVTWLKEMNSISSEVDKMASFCTKDSKDEKNN